MRRAIEKNNEERSKMLSERVQERENIVETLVDADYCSNVLRSWVCMKEDASFNETGRNETKC